MSRILPLLFLAAFIATPAVQAQDYGAMIQQQLQQGQALSNQMNQMQQGIVQQNMQNPQIQQSYQQYLQSGGTMTFDQYAYQYAATGGFSQQGMQYYRQNEQNIQQRERAAVDAYRQNQMNNQQQWQQQYANSADRMAQGRGNILSGTSDYIDPRTGQQYNLPNTNPQVPSYDPNTGNTFRMDNQGNYAVGDQNGYWYDMDEVE